MPSLPSQATLDKELDAELVRRFNAGDENAFVTIMEKYQEKLFAVALALLRNRADAEEITQDAFIRAHRGLARFRGDSSLATWLHRITINLARNRYWYFFRRKRHATLSLECPLSSDGDATFADIIPSGVNMPHEFEVHEFSGLIANCMEKLSDRHREILTLRNILDQSYEEISQALGVNVGTVKSRIARARECLRTLIAQEYENSKPGPLVFPSLKRGATMEIAIAV
jgi:RNA polymerase sigma-70 factor, ECF subfamily